MMLPRWRMRYFGSGAIIAAFCSKGPGLRMSPDFACRIPDESDPRVIFVVYCEFVAKSIPAA